MLLKLWNSIRGKSPSEKAKTERGSTPTGQAATRKLAKPTKPGRGVLGLVSGPHAGLCRQLKKMDVRSVLEIGVGDGSRAVAVVESFRKTLPESEIQYIAIDQFEMADSALTLKQFHQQIRSLGVKPNLIPMPIPQGLARLAHTIGRVDLVLLHQADLEESLPMLSRIATSDSVVLVGDGQVWKELQLDHQRDQNRKAA